ncbi:MAG TPA: hypothetical protein DD733_03375 [Clostridiales bacterium]|nr:hypothetical protein [Clostridiales bacterium]
MYSQGPYTDAATKSLYTGRNTLDNFGYYFKLNTSPSNHFEVFHNHGYETIGLYYPYYLIGKTIKKSIDKTYYTSKFLYNSEWGGIFSYYSEALKTRELTDSEYALLRKRVDLMFECWIDFYQDALNNKSSVSLIEKSCRNFDFQSALKKLYIEKDKFYNDSKEYIITLLKMGKSHLLASLDTIDADAYIDRDYMRQEIYSKYKDFFARVNRQNINTNIKNNRPGIKRIACGMLHYLSSRDKDELRFLSNYRYCLRASNDMIKNSFQSGWQNMPSAGRQLEFASQLLTQRNNDKPFYLSMHFLDPHEFISYFTYDIQDPDLHSQEFDVLGSFLKKIETNFRGSLPYLLTLRYVDYCIEKFCKELKLLGIWDNTTLMIVSDHGSSYSYYPLHGIQVNCFDDECYHVPMMIRVPGFTGKTISSFHNSMDVFPTLFDTLGFKKPDSFVGYSMIDENAPNKDTVITEYMGPGCPDLLSRRIWFSARDKKYLVAYKVGLYENFEDGEINKVYDLTSDPNGYYNISKKINRKRIAYLLETIEKRYYDIKKETAKNMMEILDEDFE